MDFSLGLGDPAGRVGPELETDLRGNIRSGGAGGATDTIAIGGREGTLRPTSEIALRPFGA